MLERMLKSDTKDSIWALKWHKLIYNYTYHSVYEIQVFNVIRVLSSHSVALQLNDS
jgi:hypothetical protein